MSPENNHTQSEMDSSTDNNELLSSYSNADIAKIVQIYQDTLKADSESDSPMADLRNKLDGIVPTFNLNNYELKGFVEEAQIHQLQAIVEAADSSADKGELRSKLSDIVGFQQLHNMDNLDLDVYINNARQELQTMQPNSEHSKEDSHFSKETIDKINQLQAIVEAADSSADKGELRSKLSDLIGFQEILEMDNIDLDAFIKDARNELEKLLKVEVEEPIVAPNEDEPIKVEHKKNKSKYKIGQKVALKTNDGEFDHDWTIDEVLYDEDGKVTKYKISKHNNRGGRVSRNVKSEDITLDKTTTSKTNEQKLEDETVEKNKSIWQRIKEKYQQLTEESFKAFTGEDELLPDDKQELRNRKYKFIAAAGVLTTGAVVSYLLLRSGNHEAAHMVLTHTAHNSNHVSIPSLKSNQISRALHSSAKHSHNVINNKTKAESTGSLSYSGDTIWNEVAKRGKNLSDTEILRRVGAVLKYNKLTWNAARHLPKGYKFKWPSIK